MSEELFTPMIFDLPLRINGGVTTVLLSVGNRVPMIRELLLSFHKVEVDTIWVLTLLIFIDGSEEVFYKYCPSFYN